MAHYLGERGMVVLDRNWRGRDGEVDIVAHCPPDTLVVVEVKTRSGVGFGTPVLAVTAAKYARLRRLAAQWAAAHECRTSEIRIDVVGVLVSRSGRVREIDHVEGAFV